MERARSFRAIAAVGAAAMTLVSAGSALAVEGDGSPYDFATGGGQTAQGDQFGFSAHDGARAASGYVTYQTAAFDIGGTVTCLNAGAGRLATIGLVIERSSDPALVGQGSCSSSRTATRSTRHGRIASRTRSSTGR